MNSDDWTTEPPTKPGKYWFFGDIMSCYDDLKNRMDIEILRGMNTTINCVDSKTSENQMIRKNILKNKSILAHVRRSVELEFVDTISILAPHSISLLNKTSNVYVVEKPSAFKMENREKLKKALREDLMNERKR